MKELMLFPIGLHVLVVRCFEKNLFVIVSNFSSVDSIHSFSSSSDLLDFADFRATDRRKSHVWQTDLPSADSVGYGIWGSARSGADRGARMGRGIDASIPAPLFSPRITLAQLL